MKNKFLAGMAAGIFLLVSAGLANAALYSYHFGTMGYSEGQSLENVTLDYATFTSEAGDLHYTNSYGRGIFNGGGADGDIYIKFSQSVSWLSFTAGDGAGDTDAFAVSLYEFGTKNWLGTWQTPKFGGAKEPEWYTLVLSSANVGSVVFDPGNSGILPGYRGGSGGVVLTDFSYDTKPVPVPATILMFGTGIVGLVGTRLRRKKQ
jgi:hypothetical protein